MRDIQKLERLVQELGGRYSIANLKMPTHGAVGLRLKDGTELYLEHDGDAGMLYAYTPVVPVPGDATARLKLFEKMLQLNYLDCGTGCGTLSVHGGTAILHVRLKIADLLFDAFDRTLQDLVGWRLDVFEKLRADDAQSGPSTRSTSARLAAFR